MSKAETKEAPVQAEFVVEVPAALQNGNSEAMAAPLAPSTPMGLLQIAVARGANVEELRALFELKREYEKDEARKAFDTALAAFKAEAVKIVKNVAYTDGPLKGKKRADLFGIVDAVTPALSRHGLSMSWKLTKDEKDWLEVTCVLRHEQGHSESVSMGGAPDTGPARNPLQARGSAKSYLERYTATAILGMAAADEDNDGMAPLDGLDEALDAITKAPSFDALKQLFGPFYRKVRLAKNVQAETRLTAAYEARKTELLKEEPA